MKDRFDLPSLLFYGMSGLMAVVCIVCFVDALFWINKPFPGILIYKFSRVGSMGNTDWPGVKAGLRLNDKILSANGIAVREGGMW